MGKKHQLMFLANDDVETPTELVGKKIAPIWVDEDGPMMESLDIIAKLDKTGTFAPASGRTDLKAWQKSVQTIMRKLQRPRYVKVSGSWRAKRTEVRFHDCAARLGRRCPSPSSCRRTGATRSSRTTRCR